MVEGRDPVDRAAPVALLVEDVLNPAAGPAPVPLLLKAVLVRGIKAFVGVVRREEGSVLLEPRRHVPAEDLEGLVDDPVVRPVAVPTVGPVGPAKDRRSKAR